MQYDSEWVQLVAFDSILTSLIKLGEPELASHIACMAYPVESETSVADFVNAIRNNSRYNKYPHNIGTRKVVEKLIPGILEALPDEIPTHIEKKNIILSLFSSHEFADMCLGPSSSKFFGADVSSPSAAIKVVNEREFVDLALSEIARIGGSTTHYKARTAKRLSKIAPYSEDIRQVLASMDLEDFIETQGRGEDDVAGTSNTVEELMKEVVESSTSGAAGDLKLAEELLLIYEGHRLKVKPKNHVLQLFLHMVKNRQYDPEAIEKFFLADFLNHPSTFVRIELLREIGKHRHLHIFKNRSKHSLQHHNGLLKMIEQFTNHPGPDLRGHMLYFWNNFVALIDSGKISYRKGSNKDKVTLLHRMNTLARFDPYIEINPNQPQLRMSQLSEDDARFCEQVAEGRHAEKLKFSTSLRDKTDTLADISEILTELNFENELDVPISADGFTRGGGNMHPITQGSGFSIDIAHVTGWQRIAVAYVNDFRHDYTVFRNAKLGRSRGGKTEDHDSHESTSIDGIFKAHLKSNREHSDYWDDSDGFIDDETFEEREDSGPSSLGVLCAPDLSGKTVALEKMQNVEVTLKSGTPYYAVIEELDEIKGAALVKYIDGSFEDGVGPSRIKVLSGSSGETDAKEAMEATHNSYHLSKINSSEIRKLTVLQSLGWTVLVIPHHEWNGLEGRREKQIQYLSAKLREVGMDVGGGLVKGVFRTIFGSSDETGSGGAGDAGGAGGTAGGGGGGAGGTAGGGGGGGGGVVGP
ncbi:hypothetical protein TrRE_jg11837 [Triparma retinervis]|uniref:RAP domain-containing protein n=1 Tax=Triparma retinervis TaxID=2557542 RepID=A0A9W7G8A5_9STRA|nr:hypothetical protein TrRE_jg11837 [Triparma retinervis]